MSIGDLGSLGEFIGSIAVLITIGYLAIQTKANRQATELQTFMALNTISATVMGGLLSSKEQALDVWQNGNLGTKQLEDEDLNLYGAIASTLLVTPLASILHAAPSRARDQALAGYEGLIKQAWTNSNFVALWDAGFWSYLIDDQREAIERYRDSQ